MHIIVKICDDSRSKRCEIINCHEKKTVNFETFEKTLIHIDLTCFFFRSGKSLKEKTNALYTCVLFHVVRTI